MVDTLDQTQLFKYLKRPVDIHQTKPGTQLVSFVIHLTWRQGTHIPFHRLDNRPAKLSKATSVFLQNLEPIDRVGKHLCSFSLLKTVFNCSLSTWLRQIE
jgi:hypothetical protein